MDDSLGVRLKLLKQGPYPASKGSLAFSAVRVRGSTTIEGPTIIADRLFPAVREPTARTRPYQMQFHLTDYCNLKCVFCPTKTLIPDKDLDFQNELSIEQWEDLIDQAVDLGIEEFHVCGGGEPFFFHKKALAVMRRIKNHGKHGEIINNGTLLRPESIRELVELGWEKITFSVDGPRPEVHDKIRAGTCFETITKNIKMFTDIKKELGVENPQLCIHFVVCNLNYKEIPNMIPLCEKLGVDTFLVQALNIWDDHINQYKLTPEEEDDLQEILLAAHQDAARHDISTNIESFARHGLFDKANDMDNAMMTRASEEDLRVLDSDGSDKSTLKPIPALLKAPCYMPWYNISVFADGRVLPCFILRDPGVSFKEYSLSEIWASEYFQRLRTEMLSNHLGKDCSKCNPWSFTKTEELREAISNMQAQGIPVPIEVNKE